MQVEQRPVVVDNAACNVSLGAPPHPLVQRLAGNVAHELNQLLTLLRHATDSLRDHAVSHQDDLDMLSEVFARADILAKSMVHVSGHPSPASRPLRRTAETAPDGTSVLVVDDDSRVRRLVARSLRKAGYLVTEVETPSAVLQALERETFSVLVTDVLMPEMNGLDLAFKALCLRPTLRVMFITGYTEDIPMGNDALPNSMEVLPKPFGSVDLICRLQALVDLDLPLQLTLNL